MDYLDVPVLLLTDGHESRMDSEVLEFLRVNGIILLIFPPNCTPILQMLDFGFFGKYKQSLRDEVSVSNSANFAETIPMHSLSSLTFLPWMKTATPERIKNSFVGTGVFPLNSRIPLERMKTSPSALVYDLPEIIAAHSTPAKDQTPVSVPSTPLTRPKKRPPPLDDLIDKFVDGNSLKKARLSFDEVKSDRKLSAHFEFFVNSNWDILEPHFKNSLGYQLDNIPDLPLFDDPKSHPPFIYPLMGSHIEDILQIPRPPTFGKKRRSSSAFVSEGVDEGEGSLDDGPRVKPFGVMTRPEIIKEKKELKEKKLQEVKEKEERAVKRKRAKVARDDLSRIKRAKSEAELDREGPIRAWLLHESVIEEDEINELSKKTISKELLLTLAHAVGLQVPETMGRKKILNLLLDDGNSHF